MVKITLKIDGMACGMCEAHVNDAIRRAFSVKKVKASHSRGQAEIIAEGPLEEAALKAAVAAASLAFWYSLAPSRRETSAFTPTPVPTATAICRIWAE